MEKILRRYTKLFDKLWLSLRMVAGDLTPSIPTCEGQDSSKITLAGKIGMLDLRQQTMSPGDVDNWDDVQDKILRVLTYKYYDADVTLLHFNPNYALDTSSLSCFDEEMEMEDLRIQDYEELSCQRNVVQVLYQNYAAAQTPESVVIDEPQGIFRRSWRRIKDFFTFKYCRR